MVSKVLVILSTGEKEKAYTGIMYATNAQKNKWLDEVKVIFFGPFEDLLCADEEVADFASLAEKILGGAMNDLEKE